VTLGLVYTEGVRGMTGRKGRWALLAGLAVVAGTAGTPAALGQSPGVGPPATSIHVKLTQIATLTQPIAMAVRTGDTTTLYVAEKTGVIVAIRGGVVVSKPVLDISALVSQGSEQGLLGLAFSPDGQLLYVDYTDTNGDSHVAEYHMRSLRADPSSARQVLFVDQPFDNHNGGNIVFGPDGYLYIGFGDGGSGGDPFGNGQSLSTLLGKILRISPYASGTQPYTVPSTNPFVSTSGAMPEIWAYGLRNPWRFSFDRTTGDLLTADVGQNNWEEVDFQPAGDPGGENYGWNLTEGKHPYNGGTPPPNWTPPVYEYSHSTGGCAIIGGYVYRGAAIPALAGYYTFVDLCQGRLRAFLLSNGKVTNLQSLGALVTSPTSFGQDAAGELYMLSLGGGVYRIDPA
jgi:glucose/arabinose dehydrogenase